MFTYFNLVVMFRCTAANHVFSLGSMRTSNTKSPVMYFLHIWSTDNELDFFGLFLSNNNETDTPSVSENLEMESLPILSDLMNFVNFKGNIPELRLIIFTRLLAFFGSIDSCLFCDILAVLWVCLSSRNSLCGRNGCASDDNLIMVQRWKNKQIHHCKF